MLKICQSRRPRESWAAPVRQKEKNRLIMNTRPKLIDHLVLAILLLTPAVALSIVDDVRPAPVVQEAPLETARDGEAVAIYP